MLSIINYFAKIKVLNRNSQVSTRFKIVFYVDHSGSGSKDELFFLNVQIVLAGPEIALKPEFMMNDILCLGVCCLQF